MEKYFPFGSVAGDREYFAADFAAYFADIISDGVSANGSNLGVTWSSGMTISVGTGFAWIKGHLYQNTTAMSLSLSVGASLPRIDRVVVRLDVANRQIRALVVNGTPASEPVAPALTRTSDVWDIGLATVRVPASAVALESSYITDTRSDNNVCGIVRSPIEKLDASEFFQNSQDAFDEWFLGKKQSAESLTLAKLQAQINAINGRKIVDYNRTTRTANGYLYGDPDHSGTITLSDTILMQRFVNGQSEPTERQLEECDFDGDGRITDADRLILATLHSRMTNPNQIIERTENHYSDGTKEVVWGLTDPPGAVSNNS